MQSILRLKIVEYFDSLRNQVDLFTETEISEYAEEESFWNKRRQDQMDEIEHMEKAGLAKASGVTDESIAGEESEMMMSKLLGGVCFLFEYGCMQFLVKVDRYVDQTEIKYLRKFVKYEKNWNSEIVKYRKYGKVKSGESVDLGDRLIQLQEMLTVDSAVVNMSWWFDQEYHLDSVGLNLALTTTPEKFNCPLRIRTLFVSIHLPGVEDIVKAIQIIQDGFRNAKSIVIALISSSRSSLKEISSLPLIEWDHRTTPVIYINDCQLKLIQSTIKLDDRVYTHLVVNRNLPNSDWFPKVNWRQIYELTFYYATAKDLDQVDLSSLCSLRKCTFDWCDMDQVDWSFLDPIRACIKHLVFGFANEPYRLSWKMFSGMTKLEILEFDQLYLTDVDLDSQGQMFADLIQLKSLSLKIYQFLLEKEWLCELPRLEDLFISFVENSDISTSRDMPVNVHFKLPMLSKLELFCESSLDLTTALSSLSHVKKLLTGSNCLRRGWFNGFKCSTLECIRTENSLVDSSLFLGLDHLISISLLTRGGFDLKDDAFGALVNLENIRLTGPDITWLERNMQKFNGLRALKSINLYSPLPYSESLVYFENLDKYILVREYSF